MIPLRFLYAFLCCLLAVHSAQADDFSHIWSMKFGDGSEQRVGAVVVDNNGNILITGQFRGTIDLGGGPLVSVGAYDIFMAKLGPNGTHIWSKRFGDGLDQIGTSIAVNNLGQPAIVGSFKGSVNFGGGNLVSPGGWDIFVAKFDENGNHLWSRSYGDQEDQLATGVAVGGGHVAVTGYYYGTVDFGGGPLPSAGGKDIFLFRLDSSSGFHMWSKRFGDSMDQWATDIDSHVQERLAITGFAQGTVDFGNGPLSSAGGYDTYVAVFEPWGDPRWSHMYGDANTDNGHGVAFETSTQAVYATGHFGGTINLGGSNLTSAGFTDIYVAKYDINGNHVWSFRVGGEGQDIARDVAVRNLEAIAVTGYFEETVDFGGGPLTSAGQSDLFIAAYDTDGNHLRSQRAGDADRQEGEDLHYTDSGEILALGHFEGTIDLGGGPLTSSGSFDVYLAKLGLGPSAVALNPLEGMLRLGVHPNPASSSALISFTLPRGGEVCLQLYDIQGRLVRTLVDGFREGGSHTVLLGSGNGLEPRGGVHFVRLGLGDDVRAEKVLFIE